MKENHAPARSVLPSHRNRVAAPTKWMFLPLLLIPGGPGMAQGRQVEWRVEPGCEDVRVFFDHDLAARNYHWDFGDGSTSTHPRPTHVFPYGSGLDVKLTLDLGSGMADTVAVPIPAQTRAELSGITMPNVFTPNGDGVNDLFAPIATSVLGACAELSVYTRWGQRVFTSQGNNLHWDGRSIAGEQAVAGTYFYVFTTGGTTLTGHVTLIR